MLICNVVGARPNFMKIAPIVRELSRRNLPQILIHTGQHYSPEVSEVFFRELGLPAPDFYLEIGSDTHARQTARIMIAIEGVWLRQRPDLVVVVGDVNSTAAAAMVAAKLGIPVAHVEAGLRSFDRTMPEELNRIVTDHLSDLLFTTEKSGNENLLREGVTPSAIHLVGNCMVDTLLAHVDTARAAQPWTDYAFDRGSYGLVTLHRPSNVDEAHTLGPLITVLNELSARLPLLFPVHPRTQRRIEEEGIQTSPSLKRCPPLPYLTFLGLMSQAKCVLTDSGGIQEETTVLGVPCLTLRENTERPVTLESGTNRLVGTDPERIRVGFEQAMSRGIEKHDRPPLWDGRAAQRLVDVVESRLEQRS